MAVSSLKLAAALLLAAPICYSSVNGHEQNLSGNIGQRINYTPENTNPMQKFKKTITTVFWVGEGATSENGYIDNYGSYWDARWMKHFGGVDEPSERKGFHPAAFRPKQNPFYVALPFAEVDRDGNLKELAKKIPGFGEGREPLTRNRWV